VTTIRSVLRLLNRNERLWLVGLMVASVITAALQVAGVGSVMPVLGVLANPDAVQQNAILRDIYGYLGFGTVRSFLILVGSVAVASVILSNAFSAMTTWLVARFTWSVHNRVASELLRSYLDAPYSMFINRNTSDLRKSVLQDVERMTGGVLAPMVNMLSFVLTILFLVLFLVWLNPRFAGLAVVILGGGYVLLFLGVRRALLRAGQVRGAADVARFKIVGEALDGIKETKILGREHFVAMRFESPTKAMSVAMINQQVLAQIPRFAIESFAFGSVLVGVVYFLGTGSGLRDLLAVVGVYAFAGYRLLPAVQNVYQSWSQIRFHHAVLNLITKDLGDGSRGRGPGDSTAIVKLPFVRGIELAGVTFSYSGATGPAIHDVNLRIARGSSVAFVGPTGAGKTTVVDVILGLHTPQEGAVVIDGVRLTDSATIRRWQCNLGYVPQEIFLVDDSVAANIAFGLPHEMIDMKAVERAARIANIHDFISTQLAQGYRTVVGERGIRLSGGQRQRIGIARALYRDPAVLVLDEATSDLDPQTEAMVRDSIASMAGIKTVIIVAHRLSTTRYCDALFVIDRGRLVVTGSYSELVTSDGTLASEWTR